MVSPTSLAPSSLDASGSGCRAARLPWEAKDGGIQQQNPG
ncbi:hypothetical protein ACP70R_049441 [Stipagrostis hirtigluma subsp. patula]